MKIFFLRSTLALFMCGVSASVWADDDVIINENFSSFEIPKGTTWISGSIIVNDWTLRWCSMQENAVPNSPAIKIENRPNSTALEGYLQTKEIGYFGDVILSFKVCKSKSEATTMKLSVLNEGSIENEGHKHKKDTVATVSKHINQGLVNVTYRLLNVKSSTKLRFEFKDNYYVIDDVVITKDGMTLSESGGNNDFITAHPNTTMNVKTSRTLKHGIWNTMCLPFEVTTAKMQQALGTEDFQMRTYTDYAGGVMTFTTASSIPAGTPFLVKPNTENDIVNPTFESVTINATADTIVNHDGVKFIGTYSGSDLNTDGSHLFITTSGTVAKPASNTQNHLKGLRAYIDLTDCPSSVRLNIDGETTDIQEIATGEEHPIALYDLKGQRLQRPTKGLCIKDGKLTFTK